MADPEPLPPYDPNDPNQSPAYRPPEATWVEGDHPTENPDGVTNSNTDYSPKTQEEKAALMNVEMVDPIDTEPNEPYPDGDPPDEERRRALLRQVHPPMDLVAAEDVDAQNTANLAAGGSVAGSIPERTVA